MAYFKTAAASLFLLSNIVQGQDDCVGIEALGTPNLDRYDYSVSMDVDDDCEFSLEFSFKHDETLPVPTDPMAQCDPSIVPPQIATDGLPFFAGRWAFQTLSDDIKEVTGIDHFSIDWNPCGHPPVDLFGAPHYDLHIYLESPEFRTCMTCTSPPGAPICDPTPGAQTTPSGSAFFNVSTIDSEFKPAVVQRSFNIEDQPRNMPANFVVALDAMVPLMGGHAWDLNKNPPSNLEWADPIWIMGPYNGGLVDYESMIPMSFFSGPDREFSEVFFYEGQTIDTLPSSYTVNYDSTTKIITVTLIGSSAPGTCDMKVESVMDEADSMTMEDSGVAAIFFLSFALPATASIIMMSSFLLF